MHTISSYRGNGPTNTHTHTHKQTDPTHRLDQLQYTAPLSLARSVTTVWSQNMSHEITKQPHTRRRYKQRHLWSTVVDIAQLWCLPLWKFILMCISFGKILWTRKKWRSFRIDLDQYESWPRSRCWDDVAFDEILCSFGTVNKRIPGNKYWLSSTFVLLACSPIAGIQTAQCTPSCMTLFDFLDAES